MNRKISANSNITQHIFSNDEVTGDYKAQVCVNSVSAKPKYPPASFGIASDMMQKDYLIPDPPSTRSFETTKPLRLDAKALPISEFSCEATGSYQMDDQFDFTMIKDMEDFLRQMLCHGFNLDKDAVAKVLCSCGYDMPKTLENLIDSSDADFENKSNSHEKSSEKIMSV